MYPETSTQGNAALLLRASIWAAITVTAFAWGVHAQEATPAPNPKVVAAAEARAKEAAELKAWREKQKELGELFKSSSEQLQKSEESLTDDQAKAAAEAMESWVFEQSKMESSENEWPLQQLEWCDRAYKRVDKKTRRRNPDEVTERGLMMLDLAISSLAKTAEESGKLDDSSESVEEGDDEHVWRYRGLRGTRSTKPRYKGQEPAE